MKRLLILFLSALTFAACKKDDTDANQTFTLKNQLNSPVKIDIYPGEENYKLGTNAVYDIKLESGASTTIPSGMLIKGNSYYVDWYTDDYKVTNWWKEKENDESDGAIIFNTAKTNTYIIDVVQQHRNNPFRSILINDNQPETKWVSSNGEATFIFRKDFSVRVIIHSYVRIKSFSPYFTSNGSMGIKGGNSDQEINAIIGAGNSMSMTYTTPGLGPGPLTYQLNKQ